MPSGGRSRKYQNVKDELKMENTLNQIQELLGEHRSFKDILDEKLKTDSGEISALLQSTLPLSVRQVLTDPVFNIRPKVDELAGEVAVLEVTNEGLSKHVEELRAALILRELQHRSQIEALNTKLGAGQRIAARRKERKKRWKSEARQNAAKIAKIVGIIEQLDRETGTVVGRKKLYDSLMEALV